MKNRWLALGLALAACAALARAQDKMPVPVEDDPTAPPELRGHSADQTPPPAAPNANTPPPPPEVSAPGTPYSDAMVAYKAGDYTKALADLQGIDPTTQDNNFVILESRILTELKRYDEGEKLLKLRIQLDEQQQTPAPRLVELFTALGDLLLHRRAYDRAAKFYTAALGKKPNDPDLTLKLIYASIGENDLHAADKLATTLSPFNPKDQYDDNPSYYFARAALAQALGRTQDADDEIQDARTNYGITVTNRYLKTYLQFFSSPDKNDKVPSAIVPTSSATK